MSPISHLKMGITFTPSEYSLQPKWGSNSRPQGQELPALLTNLARRPYLKLVWKLNEIIYIYTKIWQRLAHSIPLENAIFLSLLSGSADCNVLAPLTNKWPGPLALQVTGFCNSGKTPGWTGVTPGSTLRGLWENGHIEKNPPVATAPKSRLRINFQRTPLIPTL